MILLVTAVAAEAQAIAAGLSGRPITMAPVGVGPAAAAAGTARLLGRAPADRYTAVVCAGIAGGIGVPNGETVLAARSIAADLGADSPQGFIGLDELGFGTIVAEVDPPLLAALRSAMPGAAVGDVLTVSTATGTAQRLRWLTRRHPAAVAEAMEGFGVASAAREFSLPFAEIRTVSNPCGPRDRAAWDIQAALTGLTGVGRALAGLVS